MIRAVGLMYDYMIISEKDGKLTDTMNCYAKDGWRTVGLSSSNVFGASMRFDIVFERPSDYSSTKDNTEYEYLVEKVSGNWKKFLEDKAKEGWRTKGFTSITLFGASLIYYAAFERKLKD